MKTVSVFVSALIAAGAVLTVGAVLEEKNNTSYDPMIGQSAYWPKSVFCQECSSCECGRVRLANGEQTKIVNGDDVKNVGRYPWIAQLRYNGGLLCGASLINSRYLLTAAHCVHRTLGGGVIAVEDLSIRLLAHHKNDEDVLGESQFVSRQLDLVVRHEGWNARTADNDIALIRMDKEVELGNTSDKPSALCLPPIVARHSYVGKNALVIGWGHTNLTGPSKTVLQETIVPVVSNEYCSRIYGSGITSNMMCTHHLGGKDACMGDSGGPLMVVSHSSRQPCYFLAGIVSFGGFKGAECGVLPGVYAKVDRYLKWVKKNILKANFGRQ